MYTAGDTEDTEELVADPCVSKQVLLRNSRTFVARILISAHLPSPKGTAIVCANLDPLSLFLNVL